MKKLLVLLIPASIGAVLYGGFALIQASKVSITALQVTATPTAQVFVDDVSLGKTPFYSDKLKEGTRRLKLVPQGADLISFEEKVTLRNGLLTVVDRIFKGTEAESETSMLALEDIQSKNAVEVAVVSTPDGAQVALDEQPQGLTPLLLKDMSVSDHQITLSKQGYNSKTLRIRPTQGYRLSVSAKLSIAKEEQVSPTPSPTQPGEATKSASVQILETPTGFLRVRAEPNIASAEISKVNPGGKFPLLEEKEGWYKIQLSSNQQGWISQQYATREDK